MGTIITLLIGIFIDWNLPQPDWAHAVQETVWSLKSSSV
jgi:hypothetical protein